MNRIEYIYVLCVITTFLQMSCLPKEVNTSEDARIKKLDELKKLQSTLLRYGENLPDDQKYLKKHIEDAKGRVEIKNNIGLIGNWTVFFNDSVLRYTIMRGTGGIGEKGFANEWVVKFEYKNGEFEIVSVSEEESETIRVR